MNKETKFISEISMDPSIAITVLHDVEEEQCPIRIEMIECDEVVCTSSLDPDEFKDFCKAVAAAKKALAGG